MKEPAPETDPPELAVRESTYDLKEKFAVSERAWVIETVVVAEFELVTPWPVHPVKSYPGLELATTVGLVPWLKEPSPDTDPPKPDDRERV